LSPRLRCGHTLVRAYHPPSRASLALSLHSSHPSLTPSRFFHPKGAVIPNTMVNVTVPAGCGPGAHIIVATPTGQQVSVVVPANATVGSTFQISVPAPVAPAQAHVVMATPVAPILPAALVKPQMATIHQGGFNYSNPGFTTPKQMHVILGVPVDTTGDGVADSTGYDTTGDGNIDAVDNTGDGKINFTTGNTKAQVGSDMRPSI
jgi:hypothetical protein